MNQFSTLYYKNHQKARIALYGSSLKCSNIYLLIMEIALESILLFSLSLGRSKILVLRCGPRMNTKVAFTVTPPTTVNLLTSSRHSRRLKLGIQLNQTKANQNLKKKNLSKNLKKNLKQISKKISKKSLEQIFNKVLNLSFKLNTIAFKLVFH